MKSQRRAFLKFLGAGTALASVAGCAAIGGQAKARVVVIGAGFGGATAARYLRMWGDDKVAVDLVERDAGFVSCPLSNLVLGGSRQMADISRGYDELQRRHAVRVIRDDAIAHRCRPAPGQAGQRQ